MIKTANWESKQVWLFAWKLFWFRFPGLALIFIQVHRVYKKSNNELLQPLWLSVHVWVVLDSAIVDGMLRQQNNNPPNKTNWVTEICTDEALMSARARVAHVMLFLIWTGPCIFNCGDLPSNPFRSVLGKHCKTNRDLWVTYKRRMKQIAVRPKLAATYVGGRWKQLSSTRD